MKDRDREIDIVRQESNAPGEEKIRKRQLEENISGQSVNRMFCFIWVCKKKEMEKGQGGLSHYWNIGTREIQQK